MSPEYTQADFDALEHDVVHRLRETVMRHNRLLRATEIENLIDISSRTMGIVLDAAARLDLATAMSAEPGPLSFPRWFEQYVDDNTVQEIVFCGHDKVLVKNHMGMVVSDHQFEDDTHFRVVMHRILAPLGLSLDDEYHMIHRMLPDFTELTVLMPAITKGEIIVCLRLARDD